MKVNSLKLDDPSYPDVLRHVSGPPKELFWIGEDPASWLYLPKLAIVGSRKISTYGKEVTTKFATQATRAGAVIVSGLAFGVDAVAHQAALETGGTAVAVLPTPLNKISPVGNQQLARAIVQNGGTLISEYPKGADVFVTNFVARNRIVAGLCDVLLITEAAINSGSLHTAKFALDQGKTVMAVPGNINSPGSEGCNNLIKSGAVPATDIADILFALKINPKKPKTSRIFHGTPEEEGVLELIKQGINLQEELALASKLDGAQIGSVLTVLEISGQIRSLGAGMWTVN